MVWFKGLEQIISTRYCLEAPHQEVYHAEELRNKNRGVYSYRVLYPPCFKLQFAGWPAQKRDSQATEKL